MIKDPKKIVLGIIVPAAIIFVWHFLSAYGIVNALILPSPGAVVKSLYRWLLEDHLLSDMSSSLYRVVVGFAIGAGLGFAMGTAIGTNKLTFRLLHPLIQVLHPIPPIAYIPLSILWFGLGNPPAIFLISIGAFFPMLVNTMVGVRNVDQTYIRAAKCLGASSTRLFTRVILPGATPYIVAGMRIGMGTAFIVVIVSEMTAVNSGLGYRILEAREYLQSDKIIAGMFMIGLLGLFIDEVMGRISKHLLRWQQRDDH